MGSTSFVELFMVEVFHEDLKMIYNLPMFVDLQAAFTMLSSCYAQRLSYLFHIVFSSPKFDTYTIVTLEKLLGVGSFGGSISHLTCR